METNRSRLESGDQVPPAEINRLLGWFPDDVMALLSPHLERVSLEAGFVVTEPLEMNSHFYFPETAVFSIVVPMSDGRVIEAVTVGREGLIGLDRYLGSGKLTSRCVVQIAGAARRIDAAVFLAQPSRQVSSLLHRYLLALVNQLSQSVACNTLHTVHQRCARWLLMTHDRVGETDTFNLTQEFLSYMLGVRREAVSDAARGLMQNGVIQYRRGKVSIVDRGALERNACECYAATRADHRRLFEEND